MFTELQLDAPRKILTPPQSRERVAADGWEHMPSVQLDSTGPLSGNVALVFPSESAVKLIFAWARFGVAQHEIERKIFLVFEMGSSGNLISALDRCVKFQTSPCRP